MIETPWGTIIIFSLFCVIWIMAFAEGMARQRDMQKSIKEIHDAVQDVRDAVKSVSAKAKIRISQLETRIDECQQCPSKDRRSEDRRKSADNWMVDSDFKGSA